MKLSLNKKSAQQIWPGSDGVLTATQAHLPTPTSHITEQTGEGLGCCLPLSSPSIPKLVLPQNQLAHWPRENPSLEGPASGSKAALEDI